MADPEFTAAQMRDKYITAEVAILEGKEVRWGDRFLKMEDLLEIRAGRKEWEQRASSETASASRAPKIGGMTFKLANLSGRS